MGQIFNRRLFISETINDVIIPLVVKQLEKFYIADNISSFSEDVVKSMRDEKLVTLEGNNSKVITNNKYSLIHNIKESYDEYCKGKKLLLEVENFDPSKLPKPKFVKPEENLDLDKPEVKFKISNEFFKNINNDMSMPTMISVDVNINGQEFPIILGTKIFIQKIPSSTASKFGDLFVSDELSDTTKFLLNKFKTFFSTEDKFNKTIHKILKALLDNSNGTILALTSNELKSKQRFGVFINSIEINDYVSFKKKIYSMSKTDISLLNGFGLDYILIDESQKQVVNFYAMHSSDVELKVLTYDQLAKSLNYELKDLETLEKTTRIFMGNFHLPPNFNVSKNSVVLR